MHSDLLFFPTSLPGETLHSLISRYHFLSGNLSHRDTYNALFQSSRISLEAIYPKRLTELAERLPGDPNVNLASLLDKNSLVPLFAPFLGATKTDNDEDVPSVIASVERIPRRTQQGSDVARLCTECVRQDIYDHGASYWHRAHQGPFVTTCWRHNSTLRRACPECFRPFLVPYKLLTLPWRPCECGWDCRTADPLTNLNAHAHSYAMVVQELLVSEIRPIPAGTLGAAYRSKAYSLGYQFGQGVSHRALMSGYQEHFGEEFLKQTDPSFTNALPSAFRFAKKDGYLDMPINRHILLIMHLFGSVAAFRKHLTIAHQTSLAFMAPRGVAPKKLELRDLHRAKILKAIQHWPDIDMERLWIKARAATSWLYKHDQDWIISITAPTSNMRFDQKSRDAQYTQIIKGRLEALYSMDEKPARVNQTRLLGLLPKQVDLYRNFSRRYPLLHNQLKLSTESRWHFNVRRVLWAIAECQRLGLSLGIGNVAKTADVLAANCRSVIRHYKIELRKIPYTFIPRKELNKIGMSYNSEWPSDSSQ